MTEPLDNLQAIGEQVRTKPASWFKQLHIYSQRSRGRLRRISRLALFTPRQLFDKKTGAPIPGGRVSTLRHDDPSDVEVLLERRDRYLLVRETIGSLHVKMNYEADKLDADDLNALLGRMRQLEQEGERQLKAIEEIIWRSRDREFQIHKLLGQLISEGARLNQADRMHADRMALERGMQPTNTELEAAEAEWASKHKPELEELAHMDSVAHTKIIGKEGAQLEGTQLEGADEEENEDEDEEEEDDEDEA